MIEPKLIRELDQIREAMVDGFAGVNERLDRQNARIGTAEQRIAVLKDRGRRVSGLEPWWKQPAAIGAGSGGVFVGLAELIKVLLAQMK